MEKLWRNNRGRKQGFFSGKEDKHEHGVGFLVHKDIVNTVMGCRLVSSRHITIRLWAVPFTVTIIQAYAPTSDYDDNEIEEFYNQLQNVIDQTPKDILVVWETGMQKWARILVETGMASVDPSAIMTQMRGNSDFWNLPPLTILCWRKLFVITKHPETDNTTARLIIF